MSEAIVFARVGWMQSYRSSVTGEPGPIGGGKYNLTNSGWERDNFLVDEHGRAQGYFAIGSGTQAINLFRVDGKPHIEVTGKVSGVLVIFVAPHPIRQDFDGPVVVGWYRNATLYQEEQESADGTRAFRAEAASADTSLIPSAERSISIPRARRGIPGIGQSNIYYTRESDGNKREFAWIRRVLNSITEFEADSDVNPVVAAEVQAEKGAGFQSDPRIRKAVEERAMEVVRSHYSRYGLKDTSKTHPYDYSYIDSGDEQYIEVKGSQQENPAIFLTRNEVHFARKNSAQMELCVVHSIIVKGVQNPTASGGILTIYPRWNPDKHSLAPIQYECKLDRALAGEK